MTADILQNVPMLHIRYDGRSYDVPLIELDLGPLSTDDDVRTGLANYLDIPVRSLRSYVVERHVTGNMTVRPEAIFG
jgi:hypothetical protein